MSELVKKVIYLLKNFEKLEKYNKEYLIYITNRNICLREKKK